MDREKVRKEVWCGRRRDRRQEGEKGGGEGEQGGGMVRREGEGM